MSGQHYGLPIECFDGSKAVTTQSYTELNSKSGNQFETALFVDSLAASGTSDTLITTNSKPVLLKFAVVQFNSELISVQIFRAPDTPTGGASVPVYNLSDDEGAPVSTVAVQGGVSVVGPGTAISPRDRAMGSGAAESKRVTGLSGVARIERRLRPNTEYLIRIINEDTVASRISAYATWYEGPVSTELKLDPLTGRD